MMNGHWSDDELIGRMYGVGPEEPVRLAHLEACPDCAARRSALAIRRAALVESARSAAVDENLLRAQRDAVWRRLEGSQRPWVRRFAPVGAMSLLLLFAFVLDRPVPQPEPVEVAVASQQPTSDDELFREIASMMDETTPRAARPVLGLFDTSAQMEVQ